MPATLKFETSIQASEYLTGQISEIIVLFDIFPLRVLNSERMARCIEVVPCCCPCYIPSCCIPVVSCYSDCLNWLKRILYINEEIRIKYTPKPGTRPAQKRRFKWTFHTPDHDIQQRKDGNGNIVYRCTSCRQPEYLIEALALEHRQVHHGPTLVR